MEKNNSMNNNVKAVAQNFDDVNINGELTVNGKTCCNDDLTVYKQLDVIDNTSSDNPSSVSLKNGSVNATGTLTVGGTSNLKDTYITGSLYLNDKKIADDNDILSKVYPVGSIYMSVSAEDPANLFGGEWEQIKDRFLLACGDKYEVGETGGSADAVVVSHNHSQVKHHHTAARGNGFSTYVVGSGVGRNRVSTSSSGNRYAPTGVNDASTADASGLRWDQETSELAPTINSTGVSGLNKNMPPYLTVYMWQRTA